MGDDKDYNVFHYNLDGIIAVGYIITSYCLKAKLNILNQDYQCKKNNDLSFPA